MNIQNKESYAEFKRNCTEHRYYSYDAIHDKIFVPPALLIAWICIRLNVSANLISWFSGVVAIIGGILFSAEDLKYVLIGSVLFLIWFLLDYVDGSVARYKKTTSIEGQYIDWLMNVIANVSVTTGIAFGAFIQTGNWIIPFAILSILASVLSQDRNAFGWYSIVMQRQKNICEESFEQAIPIEENSVSKKNKTYLKIRKYVTLFFHEQYMIFLLPIFTIMQLTFFHEYIDFRVILVVLGGSIYFLAMLLIINSVVKEKKATRAYNKLFISKQKPSLPKDHWFD